MTCGRDEAYYLVTTYLVRVCRKEEISFPIVLVAIELLLLCHAGRETTDGEEELPREESLKKIAAYADEAIGDLGCRRKAPCTAERCLMATWRWTEVQ